jgi:hypothetical protein
VRRTICIIMAISFLLTVITGLAESHVHPDRSGIHTVFAILFIVSTLTHVVINRKSLARHLSGPARKTE